MDHRIESINSKLLIGMYREMSFAEDQTAMLWRSFMPRKKEIADVVSTDLYSLQIYPEGFFDAFSPMEVFTKWSAIEVENDEDVPEGMESFELPAGLYAVFTYKGPAGEGAKAFQYIFTEWLPSSGYQIDDRPHFELLGTKYSNTDPESEEEFFIPIVKSS